MQTHTKEALASVGAFVALVSVIHAGLWFTTFGTPDVTVLGFPFHYFWLVAGGPAAMFVLYWIYYQYVTTSIREEKEQLKAEAATADGPVATEQVADGGDVDG